MATYDMMPLGVGATGYGIDSTETANNLFEVANMGFGYVTDMFDDDLSGSLSWDMLPIGIDVSAFGHGIGVALDGCPWDVFNGGVNGIPTTSVPTTGQIWPRGKK